jgi:hypothetical protein
MRISVTAILFLSVAAAAEPMTQCLEYESQIVALEGKLTRQTFPGPPNYESIKNGDKPETYFVLDLIEPVCTNSSKVDPQLDVALSKIKSVQLVLTPRQFKRYAVLVGKRVSARGRLYAGHTIHHRSPVLLQEVQIDKTAKLTPSEPKPWALRLNGIGPVRIGMTLDQLNSALSENFKRPKESEDQSCFYVEPRAHPQIAFMIEDGRVVRIDVSGPGIRTDKGAQIGDSEQRVKDLYGPTMGVEPHFYDYEIGSHYLYFESSDNAIRFETEGGKVFVFYAGRSSAVSYVEGCS